MKAEYTTLPGRHGGVAYSVWWEGAWADRTRAGPRGSWYEVESLSYFKKLFSGPTEELLKNLALQHLSKG